MINAWFGTAKRLDKIKEICKDLLADQHSGLRVEFKLFHPDPVGSLCTFALPFKKTDLSDDAESDNYSCIYGSALCLVKLCFLFKCMDTLSEYTFDMAGRVVIGLLVCRFGPAKRQIPVWMNGSFGL